MHTGFIVLGRVNLGVAGSKGRTVNDAALLLGPGLAVRVGSAGVLGNWCIWARWRELPAVSKLQHITHHRLAACGEVIDGIVIEVPTQATDPSLVMLLQSDKHTGLPVPGHDYPTADLNDQEDTHVSDLVWKLPT